MKDLVPTEKFLKDLCFSKFKYIWLHESYLRYYEENDVGRFSDRWVISRGGDWGKYVVHPKTKEDVLILIRLLNKE